MKAASAMTQLQDAEARYLAALEDRRHAILESVRAGVPLREVAEAAHCSHETIRRIVATDGAVTLEFEGHSYLLPDQTVDLLIYRLAGNARGAFSRDLQLIEAGTGWLAPAGALADQLHAAMADEVGEPVLLDDARAFALHQVLRLTEMTRPSILYDLAERLRERYGYPLTRHGLFGSRT
jgi:hypothetical protein